MQYLVSVIFDWAGLATPDEMAAVDVLNDQLAAGGSKACNRKVEVRPFL